MARPEGYARTLRPRIEELRQLPQLVAKIVRLAWTAGPRDFAIITLFQLLQGVGLAVQLLLLKEVVGTLLPGGSQAGEFSDAVPELGAIVVLTVLLSFAGAVQVERVRVLGGLVERTAYGHLLDVAAGVDLEAYESPEFFNRLRRAQVGGLTYPLQVVQGLGTLLTSVFALAGLTVALIAIEPLLIPFLVLGYAPLWLASTRNSRALFRFMFEMTEDDRQRAYLQDVLSGRDEAKEIRAFDLATVLRARYDALYEERLQKLREVARRRLGRSLMAAVGSSGLTAASLGLLGYLYSSGRLSVASLATATAGVLYMGGRLRGVADGAATLYESALFVDDYFAFVNLLPAATPGPDEAPPALPFERLVIEDLTFTYPGSPTPALEDISMEIRAGEIVAVVGENGSGKTTLAKLMGHLYTPRAGRILWDGVDTVGEDPHPYREAITVIFQDFVRYGLSARENIGAGRHQRMAESAAVVTAAERAGAHSFLAALPQGYETPLSKAFRGGSDLSVGQWQRVALARAFFRDAPFVILDEPTAALDARAEYELFQRIRALFRGRSVLLISHRFSSVRSADRIYVLDKGRVVEHGTHDDLMADGRGYAEMFSLQASAYIGPAHLTNGSRSSDMAYDREWGTESEETGV